MRGDELRDQFRDEGIIRLDGAFAPDAALAIRDTVWHHVERLTDVRRSDPSTWTRHGSTIGFKRLRGKRVFAPPIDNPSVQGALDAVFGPDGWQRPEVPRAQVLLTFPTPGPWVMPAAWHMDCGFEAPTWPVPAVKIFSFFDDVDAEGGGTLVLAGSHRLVERYAPTLPPATGGNRVQWDRFMRQDPWLDRLRRGGTAAAPARELLEEQHDVDGVPVRAIELTGRPGDVVVTHLHVFHCSAANVCPRPRQMLGATIRAAS